MLYEGQFSIIPYTANIYHKIVSLFQVWNIGVSNLNSKCSNHLYFSCYSSGNNDIRTFFLGDWLR